MTRAALHYVEINECNLKTRSDILQGQALFRGVEQLLIREKNNKKKIMTKRQLTIIKNKMGDIFLTGQNQCHITGVKKSYFCHTFHLRSKKVFWWRVKSDFSVSQRRIARWALKIVMQSFFLNTYENWGSVRSNDVRLYFSAMHARAILTKAKKETWQMNFP